MTNRVLSLIAVSVLIVGCRTGVPVIDTGDKPPGLEGTLAGRVLTDGDAAVVSRIVRAIAADGTRHEATTNSAGTYSMKVPPGRYKLEVELKEGERLIKGPAETEVNASDLDPDRSFVIGLK